MLLASIITAVASALLVALMLTPRIRDFAIGNDFVDYGSARKVHVKPMPRLGGIALASGFVAAVVLLQVTHPGLLKLPHIVMIAGGVLAAALGVYDDVRGLSAKRKLLIQVAIAVGAWVGGYRISDCTLAGVSLHLGALSMPVSVIWIVGVMNAVNLIDGLDGLAGGLSIVALIGTAIVAFIDERMVVALLALALLGAVLGFLVYNRQPASIFMGDGGSLFLGFMLATLSLRAAVHPGSGSLSLMTPLCLVAVPIFDTLTAFTRRALRGCSPFRGDKEHVHHRLLRRLGSHRAVGRTLCGFAALFTATGVLAVLRIGTVGGIAIAAAALVVAAALARTVRIAAASPESVAVATPAPAVASASASTSELMADVIPISAAKPRRRRQTFDNILPANDNQGQVRDVRRK